MKVKAMLAAALAVLAAVVAGAGVRDAGAVLPPGNTAQQWDKIAEDTAVSSGAFQNESFVYMAYVTNAMYNAVSPGERKGQDADAALTEAAYTVLSHYFPAQQANLDALHTEALAAIPDSQQKDNGIRKGAQAAAREIADREGDGLQTPIASTSSFPTLTPGPGVWRLTPAAYLAPQTPWVGNLRPFILDSADRVLPPPPPSLGSQEWVDAFKEVKLHGSNTNPDTTERTTALFWTANVVRQYNGLARDIASAESMDPVQSARLFAMVDTIAADAGISCMHAKYHYLFWRPVTAIDPTSVTNDGFGPTPGFNDGNPATAEQTGWRPLINTPNHPEYPSAHGCVSSAVANVIANAVGTDDVSVDIRGFDPAGPAGNINAVHHFATIGDWLAEVANARVWGGLHYRFSTTAGVDLGTKVAQYDLERFK
jgi:PAP2 superfamily